MYYFNHVSYFSTLQEVYKGWYKTQGDKNADKNKIK